MKPHIMSLLCLGLLCASLSPVFSYSGLVLVHSTSLIPLYHICVLLYTQAVLRSELLFVPGCGSGIRAAVLAENIFVKLLGMHEMCACV